MTLSLHPSRPIPLTTRLLSFLNLIWTAITYDLLAWHFRLAKLHRRADLMGRHYIPGAPEIGMEDGKGVLGAMVDMKKSPLFLFWGKVLGPDGEPVHATLDLWQANTSGIYAHSTYNNRGILRTSPTSGSFEILTVPPGKYSPSRRYIPMGNLRAAYIHAIISAEGYERLVTKFYVCRGNGGQWMRDFRSHIISPRPQNILDCWAIPTEKGNMYDIKFPPLDGSNAETMQRVEEWNDRLSATGMRVGCGGESEDIIMLNKAR